MKTRWISLETAAEILGVSEEEAYCILRKADVPVPMQPWNFKPKYDAQAVEELAKIRGRQCSGKG